MSMLPEEAETVGTRERAEENANLIQKSMSTKNEL